MSWANQSKNSATFKNLIMHGKETALRELENIKFTDVVLDDGVQLKDLTFNDLANTLYTNIIKNSASFSNETKH